MIKLIVGNLKTEVAEASNEEFDKLHEHLSFPVPGAHFSKAYRKGWYDPDKEEIVKWDGKKHLLSDKTKFFPSGLLNYVAEEFLVEIVDERKVTPPKVQLTYELFKDKISSLTEDRFLGRLCWLQYCSAWSCLSNYKHGLFWPRGVIQAATGFSKTVTAAAIIYSVGQSTLVLVDSKDLLYQFHSTLEKFLDSPVGILGDGKKKILDVTVATIQTIYKMIKSREFKKYLRSIKVVVIDEAHKIGDDKKQGGTWNKTLKQLQNAAYRIGLSGTPWKRGDLGDIMLTAYLGDQLVYAPSRKLIKEGVLSKVEVEMIPVPGSLPRIWAYDKVYKRGIIFNDVRNEIITDITIDLFNEGRVVMILVKLLKHGEILKSLLELKGRSCTYVKGEDTVKARQRAIKGALSRKSILIASKIFNVGIDIPELSAIIIAGGGLSEIGTLQKVGRGMRKKKSFENVIIIDFLDYTHLYLTDHSETRYHTFRSEGFPVTIREVI